MYTVRVICPVTYGAPVMRRFVILRLHILYHGLVKPLQAHSPVSRQVQQNNEKLSHCGALGCALPTVRRVKHSSRLSPTSCFMFSTNRYHFLFFPTTVNTSPHAHTPVLAHTANPKRDIHSNIPPTPKPANNTRAGHLLAHAGHRPRLRTRSRTAEHNLLQNRSCLI